MQRHDRDCPDPQMAVPEPEFNGDDCAFRGRHCPNGIGTRAVPPGKPALTYQSEPT